MAKNADEPLHGGFFRDYTVIKSPVGSRWSVYWRDSYLEAGDLCWADGGYLSQYRTQDAAQARANFLSAHVPANFRAPKQQEATHA